MALDEVDSFHNSSKFLTIYFKNFALAPFVLTRYNFNLVVFPYMILPLFVGREMSIKAIEYSLSSNRMVLLLTQKDLNIENPSPEDLFSVGTVALVMRMLKLPDGRVKILVQGLSKARALNYSQTEPFFKATVEKIEDKKHEKLTIEDEALVRNVKGQLEKAVSLGKSILPDIMGVVENIEDPGRVADLVASNIGLKTEQSQEMLEITEDEVKIKKIIEEMKDLIKIIETNKK